jgi:two-component sensor histidine kinase
MMAEHTTLQDGAARDKPEESRLLKEIHHQIKNNLQVVCSLLRLESRQATSPEQKAILKRSEQRVLSMALVYDALSRSPSFFEVPIHECISDLAAQLVRSLAGVSSSSSSALDLRLEPIFVPCRVASSLGLIMNEILTDRLAAPVADGEARSLTIVLQRQDDGILLEVRDNAVSVVEDDASADASAALSMQIVRALVQQLGGTLEKGRDSQNFCRFVVPGGALLHSARH